MPSGNVHTSATIALGVGLGVAAYYQGWPLIPIVGGTLAGLILTPDLDVEGGSISNHHVKKSAGCLVALIWRVFWWPYSRLIPHRSPLSHFPIIGTAIRLAYLFGLPALILYLLGHMIHLPPLPAWWRWPVIVLALSDALHYCMDQLFRN